MTAKNMARPSKMTPEVRQKIEEAAAIDASLEEIAFYAGITRDTLWRWCRADRELSDRIEALRQRPVLKARQTVIQSLDDPNNAFRYLERKRAREFGAGLKLEHTGTIKHEPALLPEGAKKVVAEFEEAMRKELTTKQP